VLSCPCSTSPGVQMPRSFRILTAFVLLGLLGLQGCATSHLFRWTRGEASQWKQPAANATDYVRPVGVILGLPVTVVWDVVTLPFQLVWGVYPYGPSSSPEDIFTRPRLGDETPMELYVPVPKEKRGASGHGIEEEAGEEG
jgi:uncharacterized protein YceK